MENRHLFAAPPLRAGRPEGPAFHTRGRRVSAPQFRHPRAAGNPFYSRIRLDGAAAVPRRTAGASGRDGHRRRARVPLRARSLRRRRVSRPLLRRARAGTGADAAAGHGRRHRHQQHPRPRHGAGGERGPGGGTARLSVVPFFRSRGGRAPRARHGLSHGEHASRRKKTDARRGRVRQRDVARRPLVAGGHFGRAQSDVSRSGQSAHRNACDRFSRRSVRPSAAAGLFEAAAPDDALQRAHEPDETAGARLRGNAAGLRRLAAAVESFPLPAVV